MPSLTEENYLKAIYHLSDNNQNKEISTNDIARKIEISPASVSDMIKKLSQKGLVNYIKYQGVTLTNKGTNIAINIIRKHRLWETFLVEKLEFAWDEVHNVAEQLEHIESALLIKKLDKFLDFPTHDPHGDPIPNEKGEIIKRKRISLENAPIQQKLKVIAVEETEPLFLKYLSKIQVKIGTEITILEKIEYDSSLEINIEKKGKLMISKSVAENIFINIL